MTTEPVRRSDGLRAALADVSGLVERLATALDDPDEFAAAADDLRERVPQSLDTLTSSASEAVDRLLRQKTHHEWDARFGGEDWPRRSAALSQQLDEDLDAGTARWFECWLDALTSGANEEAWRLLDLPHAIAGWAAWLPDRAAAVQSAVEGAANDAKKAVGLLGNLVEVLLDYESHTADHFVYSALDRLGRDSVKSRIELLLIVARLLALAEDARALPLCQQANRLLGSVQSGDEATIGLAISATESFLWRHGQREGGSSAVETLRSGGAADLAGIHEFVQLRRTEDTTPSTSAQPDSSPADQYAGPPAERKDVSDDAPAVDATREDADSSTSAVTASRPPLAVVQQLVDGLPTVAGAPERLAAILEPPADVLVIALATRLLVEERTESAAALIGMLWVPRITSELRPTADRLVIDIATRLYDESLFEKAATVATQLWIPDLADELREPAVRLRTSITEARELDAAERAQLHASIGDEAIWAGISELGRDCFERAATLSPDDPSIKRRLADALYVSAGLRDSSQEHADLLRALELCDSAAVIEPITAENSWVHNLTRLLHQRLYRIEKPPPSARLWESLRDSIAWYATDASDDPQLWRNVTFDLRNVGLLHTGYYVSTRFHEPADEASTWEIVYSLLNTGRAAEALDLLPPQAEENEREGWIEAVRGYAFAWLEHDEAAQLLAEASETGNVTYVEWLAEFQTRRGESEAAATWETVRTSADLDDPDQTSLALCAAVYQGRFDEVRELAVGVRSAERLQIGWQCGRWGVAIADIIGTGGRDGWEDLTTAIGWGFVTGEVDRVRRLTRTILELHGGDRAPEYVARLDDIAAAETERLEKAIPVGDAKAAMLAELEFARVRLDDELVGQVIDEFMRDIVEEHPAAAPDESDETPVGTADAGSTSEGDETADPPIGALVPPSWLAEWTGRELESELFARALPLTRAAYARRNAVVLQRWVNFGVDPSCEPNLVYVSPSGFTELGDYSTIDQIEGPSGWYCPEAWLPGLSPERRGRATPVGEAIYRVPDPVDATERVSSWSAWEAVARAVFDIAELTARGMADAAHAKYNSGPDAAASVDASGSTVTEDAMTPSPADAPVVAEPVDAAATAAVAEPVDAAATAAEADSLDAPATPAEAEETWSEPSS